MFTILVNWLAGVDKWPRLRHRAEADGDKASHTLWMRVSIYGINGVPISDSDVEHVQRFEQTCCSSPGVPGGEPERSQAEALSLSVEQFRRFTASLAALRR